MGRAQVITQVCGSAFSKHIFCIAFVMSIKSKNTNTYGHMNELLILGLVSKDLKNCTRVTKGLQTRRVHCPHSFRQNLDCQSR